MINGIKTAGRIASDTSGYTNGDTIFDTAGDIVNAISGAKGQMEFQEYMDNTKYQRQVADIRKAGLNPSMLYQSGGSMTGTPNGANGSNVASSAFGIIGQTANLMNSITNARALDYKTRSNELKQQEATDLYNLAKKAMMVYFRK